MSRKILLGIALSGLVLFCYEGGGQPKNDVTEIIDSYRRTAGRWFVSSRSFAVQIKQQVVEIPDFVWVTNLIPPRLVDRTTAYQLCPACLLDKDSHAQTKRYLRAEPNFWHKLTAGIAGLKKFTDLDHWQYLRHRGEAYLVQLHRERGTLTSALVALTWLPYTAVTEVVIEPMLIGPLHTICPLFQVAYFGALDFTHSLFRNIHHTLTFAAAKIPLTTRIKLAIAARQTELPAEIWNGGQITVDRRQLNPAMARVNGDPFLEISLNSSLGASIAVNLVAPYVPAGDFLHNEQEAIHRELGHRQRWRRLYFVEALTTVALTLSDLVTQQLTQKFADNRTFEDYRQRRASIGTIRKEILAFRLTLTKLIAVPEQIPRQSSPIVVDFYQLATIVEQALVALIEALAAIEANDNYQQLVANFERSVEQLTDNPFIVANHRE